MTRHPSRSLLAGVACAMLASAVPARASTYVYHDALTDNDYGHYVPKLQLKVTPETTAVTLNGGDRFPGLFAPEVTLDGKPYDSEFTFTANGLPPSLLLDEQGDISQDANSPTLPAGTYTFTYTVTDDNGTTGTSSPVTVTVNAKSAPLEPSLPVGPCGQVFC